MFTLKEFCNGVVSRGTIKTEIGITVWSRVYTDMVTTCKDLAADTGCPKEDREIRSVCEAFKQNLSDRFCVMKECCAPSSKRMFPSALMELADMVAMAVFRY